jgi:multidrug efflux pump subunit AcrB
MEGFIVNYYEYHFLYITGIEHVESKSIQGIGLIKLQFHPGTNMAQALAETVGYVDRARAFMPGGTVPPFVMRFDAGGVPIGNLVFSSKNRSVAELQDAALFQVRPLFATLPGVSAPPPFGSSQRTIVVHADPDKLRAYNMSPGEQTAPLAHAVIGGLGGATCATLVVLPAIFAMFQNNRARTSASLDPDDPRSPHFEPRPRFAIRDADDLAAE